MAARAAGIKARAQVGKKKNEKLNPGSSGGRGLKHADSRSIDVTNEKNNLDSFWEGVSRSSSLKNERSSVLANASNFLLFKSHILNMKPPSELWLIDPSNTYKICWDLGLGILIMYSIITVPLEVGFSEIFSASVFAILDWIITSLFIIDIFLNFRTAIVDKHSEELILDSKVIARSYASFWLWIDLVSAIPFEPIYFAIAGNIDSNDSNESSTGDDLHKLRLVKVLRLIRLVKLVRAVKLGKLETYIQEMHVNPVMTDVVKLLLQIFIVAHIIACLWFATSGYDIDHTTPSWINPDPFNDAFVNATTSDKYIVSFYWTITTMLSIGYGDFYAVNSSEYIFSMVVMLLGGISFGAVIAQVTRLIDSRNPQARAFKSKMDELKAYLEEKALPDHLKIDAKAAYTYYFMKKSSLADTGLLDDVPKHMLNKLLIHIYAKEFQLIRLFRTFDESYIVQLIIRSKPVRFAAGSIIYDTGDISDDICFIIRGSVQFFLHDGVNNVVCGYAREGGYFGDFEYIKHSTRLCTYKCEHECNILSISMDNFDRASTSNVESDKTDSHIENIG